jgi:transposase
MDLTKIRGIKEQAVQITNSEVGLDMTRWNTEKQFASFLGLCPNNSISGGKVLRSSVYNQAADALRLCSQSLTHSKTALGAKYRRPKGRLGAPKAIVVMLRYGRHYVEKGMAEYEIRSRLPTPQMA